MSVSGMDRRLEDPTLTIPTGTEVEVTDQAPAILDDTSQSGLGTAGQ